MSVDGYIATNDDDISWLSMVHKEGEDYGYNEFNETVDTYIVGFTTYKTVLNLTGGEFPPAKMHRCYVITRQKRESENGVIFYNEDIGTLVEKLKMEKGKNIYCDGGSQIVQLLMQKNAIDEYIISVVPILLGEGKRLFLGSIPKIQVKALSPKHYETGLTQLHYVRV